MSTEVSAALEEIRDRNENTIRTLALTDWTLRDHPCGDVRRLLAVADVALKLHRRSDEPVKTRHVCSVHAYLHHPSPQWRADVEACPDCTVTEKWVCAEPSCRHECPDDDEWPCPTFEAISRALTGKEEEHG